MNHAVASESDYWKASEGSQIRDLDFQLHTSHVTLTRWLQTSRRFVTIEYSNRLQSYKITTSRGWKDGIWIWVDKTYVSQNYRRHYLNQVTAKR